MRTHRPRPITLLLAAFGVVSLWSTGPGHANAPAGRFTSAGMGNVFDTRTKLTWNGSSMDIPPTDAETYCSGQGAGWRLPTVKELLTLVDESRQSPAWDVATFGDGSDVAGDTWFFVTSTPYAPMAGLYTWTVAFSSGYTSPERLFIYGMINVRCVRS